MTKVCTRGRRVCSPRVRNVVCRLAFQRWCYQHGRLSEFTAAAPHAPPTDGMVTGKS